MQTTTTPTSFPQLGNTEIAFKHRSDGDLQKMEWMFSLMNHPSLNKLSINLLLTAISLRLPVQFLVKATIFNHFCGGETLKDCLGTISKLSLSNIGTILDYSVEGEKTEMGFDKVEAETIETIQISAQRKDVPFAVFKTSGIANVGILEKHQKGESLTEMESTQLSKARARFERICNAAAMQKVRVFVDGEESWIQGVIDLWAYEEMARHNLSEALIFNTFQLYRSDILSNLKEASAKAKKDGYFLGAKLVRGAYMEKEAKYADQNKTVNPIHTSKLATDKDFNAGMLFCLENLNHIHFCSGTHNEQSNLKLAEAMDLKSIQRNDDRIWFAQLFGMSDNISYNLAKEGFNVAKYVPYGPVFSVMPYLVRRASENTSVAGQTSRELTLIQAERKRRKK